MRKILFFLSSAFFFLSNGISAQIAGENLPYIPAYREQIPYFQELITGGQYAEPSSLIKGDPFYYSRQFERGTLQINTITYPDVPLVYDCYRDQLVTFHPIFNQKILLLQPISLTSGYYTGFKVFGSPCPIFNCTRLSLSIKVLFSVSPIYLMLAKEKFLLSSNFYMYGFSSFPI